ncbi:MAG: hypothetical protein OFPII_07080 [Osedax symbiont Rs1]|nr:MAG: hypothetical protein OFPII_07080 [Osedax symbiont Rs1]
MYEKSLEPISAMMDGEIGEFELRRVVERVSNDQQLKDKWLRYHLAQDVMQGRSVQISEKIDLVSRVSEALVAEVSFKIDAALPVEQDKRPAKQTVNADRNQWWKPAVSMAVAASVTAVVLLGAQQYANEPMGASIEVASISVIDQALPPSRFGSELSTVSTATKSSQPTAYGMEQYIQKHRDLTLNKEANWQVNWLPNGFKKAQHQVSSNSETLLYANGNSAVSINIEPLGSQVASQGVLKADELVAYGVRANSNFITVVGNISPQIAAKIAASVVHKTQ